VNADSSPDRQRTAAQHWRRYRRLMAWMFLFSLSVLALAVVWLVRTGTPMHLHFLIAMGLGIVLSLMLGTGLMGLVFVSSRTGIDDGVVELPESESGEER
jgi:hypothetical protein